MVVRSWVQSREDWAGPEAGTDGALLMAERPRQVVLGRSEDLPVPEDGWRQGHCFTPDWHLRWRRLGTSVRLVGFGPVPGRSGWGEPAAERSLDDLETTARSAVLWGKRQPGEQMWLELRIPNVMTPPTQHPQGHGPSDDEVGESVVRRVLQMVTYRVPGQDSGDFHRYVGLGYAPSGEEDETFEKPDHPIA
jgi:hypothetical protein